MPKRYIIRSRSQLTTSEGKIPAGRDVAVLETDIEPGSLGSFLVYGHCIAVESSDKAEILTDDEVREARVDPPEPAVDEPADDDELADEEVEAADDDDKDDELPEHWAASLELDSRTVDALDDAGIKSIEELRQKMNADEKIRGIGELREQEITEALLKN